MKTVIITAMLALLLVVPAGAAELTLIWTDNSDNENGHTIERAPRDAMPWVWSEIARVGADVTTYKDETVKEGVWYCYRVFAFNDTGKSDPTFVTCAFRKIKKNTGLHVK
jgi:hypothetical protein